MTITTRPGGRSPLLAPIAVAVAGLLTVAGLLVAIAGSGPDRADDGAVTASPDTSTTSVSPTPTDPSTTVADTTALRAGTVRIDGVTYLETGACIAFPLSNPEAGVGDAHVSVSLHRMESVEGGRVIVERWNEDGIGSVALSEPGGRYGRADADVVTGEALTTLLAMDDGTTIRLEHDLTSAVETCETTVLVDALDEFAFESWGAADVCTASEASGLGTIVTFQSGSLLHLADTDGDAVAGVIRAVAADRSIAVGAITATAAPAASASARFDGMVAPGRLGADGADDTIVVRVDGTDESAACLAAQELAFGG